MGEQRVRVMVGEGQTARRGLLRFVLENEGFDVVAEATSTLELAQRLVIHRPDVVVLDDGIDASAVGMMREVLPSAKLILVWPRGVTAVGADARLEPSEVMTSLGKTVGRVVGRGPVIAPPKPRGPAPDVIVVPESYVPVEPDEPREAPGLAASIRPADVKEEVTDVATHRDDAGPTAVAPEALTNVVMAPGTVTTPTWTYVAPGTRARGDDRNRIAIVVLAAIAGLLAIALGATLLGSGTVRTQIVAGSIGDFTLPGAGAQPEPVVTTDQPGTYNGIVRIRADGSIRLRASGDIRLRLDGIAHILASGDVKVRGDGVVNNVSSTKVRVRGNGTIRITVGDGRIRLRLQGTITARSKGTVRIGGEGRFLITHRPV